VTDVRTIKKKRKKKKKKNNYYIPCATCGEGTAYLSAEYDFTPGF
jgi:formylmethanofuran dehydrogenase subunit E